MSKEKEGKAKSSKKVPEKSFRIKESYQSRK